MQLPAHKDFIFSDESLSRFAERFCMPNIKPTGDKGIEILTCKKCALPLKAPQQDESNANRYYVNAYLVDALYNGKELQFICTDGFHVTHPHMEDHGICYIPRYSTVTSLHIASEQGGYRMKVGYKELGGPAAETVARIKLRPIPTHGCNAN